jgi:hypothetical protein
MVRLINPFNTELNPVYHLLALLGAHPILHVSRIRVKQRRYKLNVQLECKVKRKGRGVCRYVGNCVRKCHGTI